MIKISRIVIGGDKSYQDVNLMMPGEMDFADANMVLGNEKTVIFMTLGPDRRTPKWIYTHAQNVSFIILDDLPRRSSTGHHFEQIVLGNASYGPGTVVAQDQYETMGVPLELLEAKIFDSPLVFIVKQGLFITNTTIVASLMAYALVPKINVAEMPPITNEPLIEPVGQNEPVLISDDTSVVSEAASAQAVPVSQAPVVDTAVVKPVDDPIKDEKFKPDTKPEADKKSKVDNDKKVAEASKKTEDKIKVVKDKETV